MVTDTDRIIRLRNTAFDPFLLQVVCPYLATRRPQALRQLRRLWNVEMTGVEMAGADTATVEPDVAGAIRRHPARPTRLGRFVEALVPNRMSVSSPRG